MDQQHCTFKIGSQNERSKLYYVLNDKNTSMPWMVTEESAGFEVTKTPFNQNFTSGTKLHFVGFEIRLKRILSPFIYRYYLPCGAIVMVSQISFIIPLTAIPGRVALVVTQFLTLTNLFIHQMVNSYFKKLNILADY